MKLFAFDQGLFLYLSNMIHIVEIIQDSAKVNEAIYFVS